MPDSLVKKDSSFEKNFLARGGSFLFYIALLLFFASTGTYGGLLLLNRAQAQSREELVAQVKSKEEDLRPELLNQIFLLDSRLKNMRTLISNHNFISSVFNFLESNTHPKVRFSNFNFSADSRKLDMSGEALSYSVVAQQIAIFELNPQVEKAEFGGLSAGGTNLINFKVAIIFKPTLLHFSP